MTMISLVLQFLLFQPVVHADVQVKSPYAMILSQQEMDALFAKLSFAGSEAQKLQDILIEQPFKTHLQNISMSGEYEAQLVKGASIVDFSFSAKMSKMTLHIGKVSTDAVIDRIVGGVHVQIFLKGYCENVVIQSVDHATLSAGVQLASKGAGLEPVLGNILISSLPQWTIQMGACQGPLGYDKALMAEIKNILSNKKEVEKIVVSPLKAKLETLAGSLNSKVFAAQEMTLAEGVSVRIAPEDLGVGGKDAFILKGVATATLKSSISATVNVEDPAFLRKALAAHHTGVYLSQKWIKEVVMHSQSLGLLGYEFKSSSIAALKSLFSSRLYQFFLWPDLMRFARNVEFLFEMKLKSLEKMTYLYTSGDALWYDVNAKGSVRTLAPEKTGYAHYGDFGATLKSRVWIKLHKGIAVVGAYQPQFGLSFLWNAVYVKLFKPSQSISASYFGNKVQSVLKEGRYTLPLPSLEVTDTVKMRAESFSGDAEMVVIRYSSVSQ